VLILLRLIPTYLLTVKKCLHTKAGLDSPWPSHSTTFSDISLLQTRETT
jgi:hypothetical protein